MFFVGSLILFLVILYSKIFAFNFSFKPVDADGIKSN